MDIAQSMASEEEVAKMEPMDLWGGVSIPLLVGAYSVAGLYLVRAMKGSSAPLPLSRVALVGGLSAASAYATPYVCATLVCPQSDLAPFANAAISTGLSAAALAVVTDMNTAWMFAPIQVVSQLGAEWMAPMLLKTMASQ